MDIDNLVTSNEEKKEEREIGLVQIYYQKRNMRKGWTIIEGIKGDKDITGKLQKRFSCSVSVEKDGNIKMSGTHKGELIEFLGEEFGINNIKVN